MADYTNASGGWLQDNKWYLIGAAVVAVASLFVFRANKSASSSSSSSSTTGGAVAAPTMGDLEAEILALQQQVAATQNGTAATTTNASDLGAQVQNLQNELNTYNQLASNLNALGQTVTQTQHNFQGDTTGVINPYYPAPTNVATVGNTTVG